jgi:hypothetical protein
MARHRLPAAKRRKPYTTVNATDDEAATLDAARGPMPKALFLLDAGLRASGVRQRSKAGSPARAAKPPSTIKD